MAPGGRCLAPGDAPEPSRLATVATDILNVREGPTTDATILGSQAQGDQIQVVGDVESGFVPVVYGNLRGWMAVEFLVFEGEARSTLRFPGQAVDVSAAERPVNRTPPKPLQVETEWPPGPVEHWIDINRSTATVTLFEGDSAIASFAAKIGRDSSANGFYATAVGAFHVYSMNKGLAPTPFADDTWLSDWVGFDPERRNGIHSPVRDEFGNEKPWQNPATLGCVRLNAEAAVAVFEFAEIGMRVEVHD